MLIQSLNGNLPPDLLKVRCLLDKKHVEQRAQLLQMLKTSAFIQKQFILYPPALIKFTHCHRDGVANRWQVFFHLFLCPNCSNISDFWKAKLCPASLLSDRCGLVVSHHVLLLLEKGAPCKSQTMTVSKLLRWCFCGTWDWEALGSSKLSLYFTKNLCAAFLSFMCWSQIFFIIFFPHPRTFT